MRWNASRGWYHVTDENSNEVAAIRTVVGLGGNGAGGG